MKKKRTSVTLNRPILAAFTLALTLLPAICSSKSHDLRLGRAANRGLDRDAGSALVIDIESHEILVAQNPAIAYLPRGRGLDAATIAHAILEEYGQAKRP